MKKNRKKTKSVKIHREDKNVVYELECWVRKGKNGEIEIHHTNNGGFPAPGQLGDPMAIHPAKLIVYKNGYQTYNEEISKNRGRVS